MQEQGMDRIATGHYARIGRTADGYLAVQRGMDNTKDQSYFLCRLDQEQLEHMVMPLGEHTKKEVYKVAAELNLNNVHGPESQDICFLAGRSIATFFAEQGMPDIRGEIVTSEGKTLGHHNGLWHYTIGQRRGLGLPDASPWYVQRLDHAHNRVIICKEEELITNEAMVSDVKWSGSSPSTWRGLVQIRGRQKPSPALVEQVSGSLWRITFDEPQRAVTPGQFAAFYEGDLVCGSGIITEKDPSTEGSDS